MRMVGIAINICGGFPSPSTTEAEKCEQSVDSSTAAHTGAYEKQEKDASDHTNNNPGDSSTAKTSAGSLDSNH